MMISNRVGKAVTFSILVLLVASSFTMMIGGTHEQQSNVNDVQSSTRDTLPYEGHLRVYITEPTSRWNMQNGQPYHFGMLGFALDTQLSINYLGNYDNTFVWNGDVTEQNALVMAAVFDPDLYQGYAYPPSSNPFDAYYVDAAAAATPGNTGYSFKNSTVTHTVLVEEGTATWCPYCPAMAEALFSVYQSHAYPFYFVALIDDASPGAAARLRNDYNIYGFPTAFFDGGYKVIVGGDSTPSHYATRIQSSGQRTVANLNLSLSVTYVGYGDLQIHVRVTNNQQIHAPLKPTIPAGATEGNVGVQYTFTTSTTDEDGGDLYYFFDWGDNTNSGWIGTYASGAQASAQHIWSAEGTYQVKVKAKDRSGHESDWSDPASIHLTAPVFVFTVTGKPFGINATIKNNGNGTLPSVGWGFTVNGGLLKLINIAMSGTIHNFASGSVFAIEPTQKLFGLGKLTITVSAIVGDATTPYETTGFILGPFVFISK